MLDKLIIKLAKQLGQRCVRHAYTIGTAESCTGGLVAAALTHTAGASHWFDRGFVTYTNEAKQNCLGVDAGLLAREGAVSAAVALAMAQGVLQHSQAQLSLAITGIAGPTGGSQQKPVGTVWIAAGMHACDPRASVYHFSSDRSAIRTQAAIKALEMGLSFLNEL